MQPRWKITSLVDHHPPQTNLPTLRLKTLPDIRISCKKIEEGGKYQTFRTTKKYSSAEL